MQPHEALPVFRELLLAEALDPECLPPWPTWKLFKSFLSREVQGAYDAASFQCGQYTTADGTVCFFAALVRQFTTRAGGEGTDTEDRLVGRLIVEWNYPSLSHPPDLSAEIWTLDFPGNHAWASVVEGLPGFQEAMAREPSVSSVCYDA